MKTYVIGYYPYGNNNLRYSDHKGIGTSNIMAADFYVKTLEEMINLVKEEWKCDCVIIDAETEEFVYFHKL